MAVIGDLFLKSKLLKKYLMKDGAYFVNTARGGFSLPN